MSFLEQLRAARATPQSAWTQFVSMYRDGVADIFLFFEGKDDPGFYLCHLRPILNPFPCLPLVCGGKEKVFALIPRIKERIDIESRALFFVDRDVDEFVEPAEALDRNCYETEWYSVEHYIVNENTLDIVWVEFFRLPMTDERFHMVKEQFRVTSRDMQAAFLPVMASIIALRKMGEWPNLSDVNPESLVEINPDMRMTLRNEWWHLFKEQSGVVNEPDLDVIESVKRELSKHEPGRFVRGKWALWMFVMFIRKVQSVLTERAPVSQAGVEKQRANVHVNFTEANALSILSGKINTPSRLAEWLRERRPRESS